MMKRTFTFALVILVHLAASAQIRVKHTGDELPPKAKDKIAVMVSYMNSFYSRFLLQEELEVELLSFKDKKEGYRYMRGLYPDDLKYHENPSDKTIGGGIAGVYLPKYKRAVILGMEKGADAALYIIYHELSHHFTRMVFQKRIAPVWLNEGLAEYFEHLKVKGTKISGIEFPEFQKGKIRTLAMLGELDLVNFLNLSQNDFYRINSQDGQYYYGLSYAVVTVLMDTLGQEKMAALVKRIAARDTSSKISDLVADIYPQGIPGLENDLLKFVQR